VGGKCAGRAANRPGTGLPQTGILGFDTNLIKQIEACRFNGPDQAARRQFQSDRSCTRSQDRDEISLSDQTLVLDGLRLGAGYEFSNPSCRIECVFLRADLHCSEYAFG
jgi:hypothetical protein